MAGLRAGVLFLYLVSSSTVHVNLGGPTRSEAKTQQIKIPLSVCTEITLVNTHTHTHMHAHTHTYIYIYIL